MAQVRLADGRVLDYHIHTSSRTRSLRLKLSARDGLRVTAPAGVSNDRVLKLVTSKADWIAERLSRFDEVRHLLATPTVARPQAFALPGLAESWCVEYRQTAATTVGARTERPGRIIVSGAVTDTSACVAGLRRWLARHAKQTLTPWLEALSRETGMRHTDVTIKTQRTRWGSCSANGRISLNCKLMFLPRDSVRYVLVHELCHTQEMNHTVRFWAIVRRHEPRTEKLHASMRDAWKAVPVWASQLRIGEKGL